MSTEPFEFELEISAQDATEEDIDLMTRQLLRSTNCDRILYNF